MAEEKKISQILEELTTRIDNLTKIIEEKTIVTGDKEAENLATKIEKMEHGHFLTYIVGAFSCGLIIGMAILRRVKD